MCHDCLVNHADAVPTSLLKKYFACYFYVVECSAKIDVLTDWTLLKDSSGVWWTAAAAENCARNWFHATVLCLKMMGECWIMVKGIFLSVTQMETLALYTKAAIYWGSSRLPKGFPESLPARTDAWDYQAVGVHAAKVLLSCSWSHKGSFTHHLWKLLPLGWGDHH